MIKEISKSVIKKLLPERNSFSHKGQNGRVLIVGGSIDYYGAPVLAALGSLYSGVDMVYLYVPECNFECTRSLYPDFVVKKYPGEFLNERSAAAITDFGKKCDSVLIGPGLGDREKTIDAVMEIVKNLHIPTVLDADALVALKKIDKFPVSQTMVITPHRAELQNLVDREVKISENDPKSFVLLRSLAMDLHINVLLKGPIDYISSEEGLVEANHTGNAGMTVGGSGDVLAGVVASFMAQGLQGFDAARCAAYMVGRSGDLLKKQKGYNYSASDIALSLPYAMDL